MAASGAGGDGSSDPLRWTSEAIPQIGVTEPWTDENAK